ncbi:TorF family putative porin [Shewanella sp.]|uniref:TorF family putative porin n=1 Tax=Shewanella sp. TaxID=50422 RepID=UPI003562DD37
MTKTSVCLTLLGALAACTPATAAFDANIGLSSNYLWRGISQTGDAVAVDGSIDYSHDSGFYAGVWASNIDFGDDTTFELDLYGGYSGEITESISFDVGYLYYGYPDADADIDFSELYASLSWQWLTLGYARVIHGGNGLADDALSEDDMDYLSAEVAIPLSDSLSLDFHYGYSSGDLISSWYDESSYSDYSAAITKSTELGEVSFIVSDTDLTGDDPKVVLRWAYSFGL